ncbi:MAG: hypothetical protein II312_14060 [Lachnospiraceae bacterium]|nr:hypothetical protein [Lachnospiraceae bacterium]
MRITTQMLQNSSIKSGITFNKTSLLDYMNDSSKAENFINSLANGSYASQKSSSILSSKNYKNLLEKSETLEKNADKLCKTDEKSDFATAKEKNDKKILNDNLEEFIKNCNEMLEALNSTQSAVDSYYAKTLKEVHTENKDLLSQLGISYDTKTGKLSYDIKKIEELDFDGISDTFGKLSSYTDKVKFIASRAIDNANTSLKSPSNIYNSKAQMSSSNGYTEYNSNLNHFDKKIG